MENILINKENRDRENYKILINKIDNNVKLSQEEKDRIIYSLEVAEKIKNKS